MTIRQACAETQAQLSSACADAKQCGELHRARFGSELRPQPCYDGARKCRKFVLAEAISDHHHGRAAPRKRSPQLLGCTRGLDHIVLVDLDIAEPSSA